MNLIITGMRGSGKSTLGVLLAEKLGLDFVDLDLMIEEKAGMKIKEIVEIDGWERFRGLEKEVSLGLGKRDGLVIATGGGTLMFEENFRALKSNGLVLLLICAVENLALRISGDENRPSLGVADDAVLELAEIWQQRKERYLEVADFVYRTDSLEDAGAMVAEILTLIKRFFG